VTDPNILVSVIIVAFIATPITILIVCCIIDHFRSQERASKLERPRQQQDLLIPGKLKARQPTRNLVEYADEGLSILHIIFYQTRFLTRAQILVSPTPSRSALRSPRLLATREAWKQ